MLGDCKEQYQNLRRLTLAPKTKENYAEIIFAYINGAAEFFSDLSGLCSSLERYAAHANSREYSDYEFISSVRHANHLNRYDEYANELGWCLKELGCTYFGMKEEDFVALKTRVLSSVVKKQNPKTLREAMKRLGRTSLPGLSELQNDNSEKQSDCNLMFDLFYATPNSENLSLLLGMYDGALLQTMVVTEQLNGIDITGLDFEDSRIDEIINLAIKAAEARIKTRAIKELIIRKFGLSVVEKEMSKIEERHQSGPVGIFR